MKEYLPSKQPIIAATFTNAIKQKRLSHAYLLNGEAGTPLKEIAIYLAQSLVCESDEELACEHCWNCLRIADGNYADFTLIDGALSSIKKDAIQALEHNYDKTSIEAAGKLIYVIHLVENMTDEAVNSLLKFLEEPGVDVYAFLTTENASRVLPTIVSRSQVINVRLQPRQLVIDEAVELGVAKEDAEILSYFYNAAELVNVNKESEEYLLLKEHLTPLLSALSENINQAVYLIQNKIAPAFRTKEAARMFFDSLVDTLLEAINLGLNNPIVLNSYVKLLTPLVGKVTNLDQRIIEIMKVRGQLDLNLNIALVFDHLAYIFLKEIKI